MAARTSDISSTKTAKNVDEKLKNKLPSMKNGKNVDENTKSALPSTTSAENEDGSPNFRPLVTLLPHVFVSCLQILCRTGHECFY